MCSVKLEKGVDGILIYHTAGKVQPRDRRNHKMYL